MTANGNDEGLLLAAVFAASGYIVVAPNYVGYDISTLGYHPYLDAVQQSDDMIDALKAARSALPARRRRIRRMAVNCSSPGIRKGATSPWPRIARCRPLEWP